MKQMKLSHRIGLTLIIFAAYFFITGVVMAQDKGTFVDKRDNHAYKFAKLGKQVWMLQNLAFVTPAGSWTYNDNDTTGAKFGKLYDWNTAMKACPKGWKLPTDADWTNLIQGLGGVDAAGGKFQEQDTIVKDITAKKPEITGGFSGLLGGVRHEDNKYTGVSFWGGCWSATATGDEASNYLFVKNGKSVAKSSATKKTGQWVRCVRVK
jgi:uncharacterized protein (TIGR02145 family)